MDLDTINAMSNDQLKEEVTIPWPTMGRSQDGQSAYQDSFSRFFIKAERRPRVS